MVIDIKLVNSQNIPIDFKGPNFTMGGVQGDFLGPSHSTTPAAVITNKTINIGSFESSDKIQRTESGPCCTISDNERLKIVLQFNEFISGQSK